MAQKFKVRQQKILSDQHVQLMQERKRKEAEETMLEEKNLVRKLQNEIEEENQDRIRKRQAVLDQYKKVKEVNEQEKLKAMEKKQRERLDDIEAMKEYSKQVELMEKRRNDEITAREKRMQDRMDMMKEQVYVNQRD